MLTDESKQRLKIVRNVNSKVQLDNAMFHMSLQDSNADVSILPDWTEPDEPAVQAQGLLNTANSSVYDKRVSTDSIDSVLSSIPVPPPRKVRPFSKRPLPQAPNMQDSESLKNAEIESQTGFSMDKGQSVHLEIDTAPPTKADSQIERLNSNQQPLYQLSAAAGSPMTVPPPIFQQQHTPGVPGGFHMPAGSQPMLVTDPNMPLPQMQFNELGQPIGTVYYDPSFQNPVYQSVAPEGAFIGPEGAVYYSAPNPFPGYVMDPQAGYPYGMGYQLPNRPAPEMVAANADVMANSMRMFPGPMAQVPDAASSQNESKQQHMTAEQVIAGAGMEQKRDSAKSLADQSSKAGSHVSALPFQKSLELYRLNAKKSHDPAVQLDFAKYLIALAEASRTNELDPGKAQQLQESYIHEGLKLIKKLATQGGGLGKSCYAEAQFYLAECYGNGSLGLPIDHEKAFNLYVQASKQNHASATYRTAVCYEMGAGAKRDSSRAAGFYRKAAKLGDTAAMYKLGMIVLNGLLSQNRNVREGVSWLKRAAAQADSNCPHALHELGVLYEARAPETQGVVHQDVSYAHELYAKAAQLGYPPSQFKLGQAYEYGQLNLPVDPRRSIAWYTRAAEQSDSEAELALSGWYLTGADGILKQSDTEAYLWARKAADKGLAKAEYAVGYYSEHGIGVRADLEEAKRWYIRSAGQSNKKALKRLKELKTMSAYPKSSKNKQQASPNDYQSHGEIDYGLNGQWRKEKDSDCSIM